MNYRPEIEDKDDKESELRSQAYESAKKKKHVPRKVDYVALKQILKYKNAYKSYNTQLFRNRKISNKKADENEIK